MFQIDNDTSSQTMPAPTAAGTPGYFVDGDPAKGLAATILPAEFMNMLMMEFINLVKAAGLTPSKGDYAQLSKAIPALIAKLATVDWSKVTNIPADLLHANTSVVLASIELFGPAPFIDFHVNSDASDFNVRLINDADGRLTLVTKTGTIIWAATTTSFDVSSLMIARRALAIPSQGAGMSLSFNNADNSLTRFAFNHTETALNLCNFNDAGGFVSTVLSLARATGVLNFTSRPTFGGNTPWDSANFTPANKADKATTLAGYGIADALLAATYNAFISGTYAAFVSATNGTLGSLSNQIAATNNNLTTTNNNLAATNNTVAGKQANLGFTPVRQGGGVAQLGNVVYLGWDGSAPRITIDSTDMGRVVTDQSVASFVNYYLPGAVAAQPANGVGTYALLLIGGGSITGSDPLMPGTLVSGANCIFTNVYGNPSGGAAAGTWRLMGYVYNHDGSTQDSITLALRVA